jgi:hypothetical protein
MHKIIHRSAYIIVVLFHMNLNPMSYTHEHYKSSFKSLTNIAIIEIGNAFI